MKTIMKKIINCIEENLIDENGHVYINDNVNVINIDPYKDYYDKIKSITIGRNVQVIQDYSFYKFKNLETVEFLCEDLMYIGTCCFCKCSSLKNIDLSKSFVASDINNSCFKDCINLEKVILNKNIRNIYYSAFSGCISLKEINLEDTKLEYIGDEAFLNCNNLNKIILPSTVEALGNNVFTGCNNIEIEMNLSNVEFKSDCFDKRVIIKLKD